MRPLLLWQALFDLPPEGLARGRLPAPWWMIAAIGGLIVVLTLVYLGLRLRRALRGKG